MEAGFFDEHSFRWHVRSLLLFTRKQKKLSIFICRLEQQIEMDNKV